MSSTQLEAAYAAQLETHLAAAKVERELAAARKAARTGPHAAEIMKLEQRDADLLARQAEVMREAAADWRTLDHEEAAQFDALQAERDELAHRLHVLTLKHLPCA